MKPWCSRTGHPAHAIVHGRWGSPIVRPASSSDFISRSSKHSDSWPLISVASCLKGCPGDVGAGSVRPLCQFSADHDFGDIRDCLVTKTRVAKDCSISWMDLNHPRSYSSTKELRMVPVVSSTESFGEGARARYTRCKKWMVRIDVCAFAKCVTTRSMGLRLTALLFDIPHWRLSMANRRPHT